MAFPYGYPSRFNVKNESELLTIINGERQQHHFITVLSRTAIYFYSECDMQLLCFTRRYGALDEGVVGIVENGNSESTRNNHKNSNNGGNVSLVYALDSAQFPCDIDQSASGTVFGNVALLTEAGTILHYTMVCRKSPSHTEMKQFNFQLQFTSVFRPPVPCLSLVKLESNAHDGELMRDVLLVSSLVDGTMQILRLTCKGIEYIYDIHIIGKHDFVAPDWDSDELENTSPQCGMHSMSCHFHEVNHYESGEESDSEALVAGVTPEGECETFLLKRTENTRAVQIKDTESSTKVTVRYLVSLECKQSATCISISEMYVAVGMSNGGVLLFLCSDIINAKHKQQRHALELSNSEWGYSVSDTGAVTSLAWTTTQQNALSSAANFESNRTTNLQNIAVGTRRGTVTIWSQNGCRTSFFNANGSAKSKFDVAVAGCCWSENGMTLWLCVQSGGSSSSSQENGSSRDEARDGYILQIDCIRTISERIDTIPMRCTSNDDFHKECRSVAFLGKDRLVLVGKDVFPSTRQELQQLHVCIPDSYLRSNRPLSVASMSKDCSNIAVSGLNGFTVYNARAGRWKMFGDVSQERAFKVLNLTWIGSQIICACVLSSGSSENSSDPIPTLCFYRSMHLNTSKMLDQIQIQAIPSFMSATDNYLFVAFDSYLRAFNVFQVKYGNLLMTDCAFHIEVVHKIQESLDKEDTLVVERSKVISAVLVPIVCQNQKPAANKADEDDTNLIKQMKLGSECVSSVNAIPSVNHILLLRVDGVLSLRNIVSRCEVNVANDIERVWMPLLVSEDFNETDRSVDNITNFYQENPIWVYGRAGIQAKFLSCLFHSENSSEFKVDFDNEIAPLGFEPTTHVVTGVRGFTSSTQNVTSYLPFFSIMPKEHSLLPVCFIIQIRDGLFHLANRLLWKTRSRLDFKFILEIVIYKALMIDSQTKDLLLKKDATSRSSFLKEVIDIAKELPHFFEAVVGVARKTDHCHWNSLLDAVGDPTTLFDANINSIHEDTVIACAGMIRVIEFVSGISIAQEKAFLSLQRLLDIRQYKVAGEVVQFLVRCGQDPFSVIIRDEVYMRTVDNNSSSGMNNDGGATFRILEFALSMVDASPERNSKQAAKPGTSHLKQILYIHAAKLVSGIKFHEFHKMSKRCKFDAGKFLREDGSPRSTTRALCDLHDKLASDQGLQRELLFGLQHEFGCNVDWCLVIGTVLNHQQTVLECLAKNESLLPSYKDAANSAANSAYKDFVTDVETALRNRKNVL